MPEPEKEDKTAEFLAIENQGEGQPLAVESPVEEEPKVEPAEEPAVAPEEKPEKKAEEPEAPKAEESLFSIPEEDRDAIFADWGRAVTEEPLPIAPQPPPAPAAPPAGQPIPSDIPVDVLQITPQQFMPQGQEFDPADVYTPNSPSNLAGLRAQAEQVQRMTLHEREKYNQEQMARAQMEAIENFVAQKKREGVPDAAIQGFINEITDGRKPISLQFLWDAKLLERSQALRKAQGSRKSKPGEEVPAPVTKATRVVETLPSPDELQKQVSEMLGEQEAM